MKLVVFVTDSVSYYEFFFSGTLDSLLVSYANLCSGLLLVSFLEKAVSNIHCFLLSVEVIHNKMLLGCSMKFGGKSKLSAVK